MLKISDDDLKWIAKIIKYNDSYQSIKIEFENHHLWIDLILGEDYVCLEARRDNGEIAFKSSFKPSEIE